MGTTYSTFAYDLTTRRIRATIDASFTLYSIAIAGVTSSQVTGENGWVVEDATNGTFIIISYRPGATPTLIDVQSETIGVTVNSNTSLADSQTIYWSNDVSDTPSVAAAGISAVYTAGQLGSLDVTRSTEYCTGGSGGGVSASMSRQGRMMNGRNFIGKNRRFGI